MSASLAIVMSAAEGTYTLRGKEVTVREGDLILLYDKGIVSRILGPFNSSWSHVVTVVAYQGRLMGFSVYMPPDGLFSVRENGHAQT